MTRKEKKFKFDAFDKPQQIGFMLFTVRRAVRTMTPLMFCPKIFLQVEFLLPFHSQHNSRTL